MLKGGEFRNVKLNTLLVFLRPRQQYIIRQQQKIGAKGRRVCRSITIDHFCQFHSSIRANALQKSFKRQ